MFILIRYCHWNTLSGILQFSVMFTLLNCLSWFLSTLINQIFWAFHLKLLSCLLISCRCEFALKRKLERAELWRGSSAGLKCTFLRKPHLNLLKSKPASFPELPCLLVSFFVYPKEFLLLGRFLVLPSVKGLSILPAGARDCLLGPGSPADSPGLGCPGGSAWENTPSATWEGKKEVICLYTRVNVSWRSNLVSPYFF